MSTSRQLPNETISAIVDHIDNPHDLYQCTLTNTAFYKLANPKLWHDPTKVTKLSYYDFVHILVNDRQKKKQFAIDPSWSPYTATRFDHEIVRIASIRPIDPRNSSPYASLPSPDEMFGGSFCLVPEFLPILCPRLRTIVVTGYNNDFLRNLGNCRRLRTLDLDDMFLDTSYDGLASLRNCPLNSLSIVSQTWAAIDNISDLQQLTRLSTLEITTQDDDTTEVVEQLLFTSPQPSTNIAFPRLKSLRINCEGVNGVETHTLVHILTTYSKLRELSIGVDQLNIIQGHVFPHLRSLRLTDDGLASKEAIHSWINACPGLIDFLYSSNRELYDDDYDDDDNDDNGGNGGNDVYYYDTSYLLRVRSGGPL
ncbi:hypothetical protein [Absidia glauca]|uniref:F-box domain-containing protein n=1 Tax=Absidia glauca TaxID=4829 RepID=A0A163JYU3_ABSGL|nr:hypothetical protein [Absidia glauca]